MRDGQFIEALLAMFAVFPKFRFIEGCFSAKVAAIGHALVQQNAITFESGILCWRTEIYI